MFSIKNKYLGDLRTEAVHLKSGNTIITDAPLDNNGKGEAFSPTDLVSAALCSCMMTIMGITARKENLQIDGVEAEVTKIMTANPRKISEIHVNFTFPAGLSLSEEFKGKLEHAAHTCPVALSLDPAIKQIVSFNY